MAHISSTRASASNRDSTRDRASASTRDKKALLHHHISQSFDLCPATTSVSHLTYPLPPHQSVIWLAPYHHITALKYYHISQSFDLPLATTSVSHLTCPLPPHQSVIWLAHCHHISQSFDMPSATISLHYHITALLCHCVSQSFDLPTATTSVNHLTCPLPPHQSVIWHALYHCVFFKTFQLSLPP